MKINDLGFRKRFALELFRLYRRNEARVHQLNYLMWECTLRCNLNCVHCGSDCRKESSVPDMPMEDFLTVVDQLKPHVQVDKTTIVFTGGEPLLRNDLEECGLGLNERGFPWGIVTNGMLLTPSRLESLLEAGMCTLSLSIDGFQPSHNRLRGRPESYACAHNALGYLAQTEGLIYDVVTCVSQYNYDELVSFREMLINEGVKRWRLFTVFPIGRALLDEKLQLTKQQFNGLFEFIAQMRNDSRIQMSYGCEGYLGDYETRVRDSFFFCRAGITVASILADGSITGCTSLRQNYIQGNIYNDSFMNVWNKRFEIMRKRTWTKNGQCADCDSYRYCEGNGLHLRDEKTGELLMCHYNQLSDC